MLRYTALQTTNRNHLIYKQKHYIQIEYKSMEMEIQTETKLINRLLFSICWRIADGYGHV